MNRNALLAGVAVALAMGVVPAVAQMQQKGPEDKGGGPPQMQGAPGQTPGARPQVQQGNERPAQRGPEQAEPKAGTDQQPGKGTAQTESKDKSPKASTPKSAEPKDRPTKGAAEKSVEPKDKATKGAAEKGMEPKDKATKGTAEKSMEPKDKATKGTAEKGTEPKDKAGSGSRAQLSEQQRTSVSQTILKDTRPNRVTNVNFSINVGGRVPRSLRLAVLPASVIAIVPAYRSYHYFMIDERICIVEPTTYEIVEIITVSDQSARTDHGGAAILVLTQEERTIILREVDMDDTSTLALGALTEGVDVPGGVKVRVFSDAIVQKVPKLRGYRFFTAEKRVAIVDPQGARVRLVIEERR